MPEQVNVAGASPDEKRACPRKRADVRCWIEDGICRRYARLVNISLGGAMVQSAAPPDVGRSVLLSFLLLPSGQPVIAEGRVVWRSVGFSGRGGMMGVQFLHVSDIGHIKGFIERG